jgi:hypothetical protein
MTALYDTDGAPVISGGSGLSGVLRGGQGLRTAARDLATCRE